SVPVGDTFGEGEQVLVTSEELTTEDFGDIGSGDVISIIETPDSSTFSYQVDNPPNLFVKLTDKGEVFVLNDNTFWCYTVLPEVKMIYMDNIAYVPGYDDLRKQYMINVGWEVLITDVEPLIITPDDEFDRDNWNAVVDIAFMYCYTPPVISGETPDNTAPERPSMEINENMSFDEVGDDDYDDEAAEGALLTDTYGNERPYYVFAHYRRQAGYDAEFVFWMNESAEFLNMHTGFTGYVPRAGSMGIGMGREIRVTELYFHRAGDYRNYGYLLICTPMAIVLYDGLLGTYEIMRSQLGGEIFRRITAGEHEASLSTLDSIRFDRWGRNTLNFTYRAAVPIRYGWDSAQYPNSNTTIPGGEIKYFRMRSNSQSIRDLGIVLNREHTLDLLAEYTRERDRNWGAFGRGFLEGSGWGSNRIVERLLNEGAGFALLRNSGEFGFFGMPGSYSREEYAQEYDRLDPNNMTWDENATYISQMNTPAFSDLNFLKQGSTIYVSTYRESGKKDSGFPAGLGFFNFTTQTKPVWQVSGDNIGIYQPYARLKYENAGVHLRMSSMPIVLHATLEDGLSVYLEKNQANLLRLETSGSSYLGSARGRYFIEGYRISGAFYNVFHSNGVAQSDCLLVGFMGANRIVTWADLKDASALVVKLGNDEYVEPDWIYLP
ncbi:MAG: hypothetical protein FWH00_04275, partial [Oscillospiraceae bacterium]|nr:hypothetical protein [Oscillospiraceae bacterium]